MKTELKDISTEDKNIIELDKAKNELLSSGLIIEHSEIYNCTSIYDVIGLKQKAEVKRLIQTCDEANKYFNSHIQSKGKIQLNKDKNNFKSKDLRIAEIEMIKDKEKAKLDNEKNNLISSNLDITNEEINSCTSISQLNELRKRGDIKASNKRYKLKKINKVKLSFRSLNI